jgi:succinate-semialdehyde dehydrogenase/glutarate-semialdehyde dehydrogenase
MSSLKSVNPFDNKVLEKFQVFTNEKLQDIIDLSEKAFKTWKETGLKQRSELLKGVASILERDLDNLARSITMEMGKPIKEARAEVKKCALACEYYANNAQEFLNAKNVATDAQKSYVCYEPLGTILGIMPWNFPFWQVFRFSAPSLMAGNVVLLKHASNVQRCSLNIEEIFRKAGFPDGVFRSLIIGSDKVASLIENNIIKAITLTGSESAGSKVAGIAGENIKKTVLELGGSNPFIVLKDANIDKSVDIGVQARMMNGGQSCIAAKRFILHKDIAEEYISKFEAKVNTLKIGNPLDESTDMGPLASIAQAISVEDQVNRSVDMGARLLKGGRRLDAFYYPTLLTNVKPGMPVFDEEVFGPVAPFILFDKIEEAIELANSSKYGLGVTICTNNLKEAEKLIPFIDDGAVFINELVKSDPRLPFGGTKRSGYGRELAINGIHEFVNIKTVYIRELI